MIYAGGGITRNGCYDLRRSIFIRACNELLKTGDGKLDEHDKLTWLSWEGNEIRILSDEECDIFNKAKDGKSFWGIYTFFANNKIDTIKAMVDFTKQQKAKIIGDAHRRRTACMYTARPDTRKAIFDRDGEICKKCESTENLSLDHIIPVSKEGEDSLENLQVLCKSCNSKKSNSLQEAS